MEKNTHIHIRVSEAELREFKRLAGDDTVSNYIRQRLGMPPARNGGKRPGAGRKKSAELAQLRGNEPDLDFRACR